MSQKRIVFFPVPEHGHVYPTLEIARHYAARGCDVVYLTAPQFAGAISSVGARIHPVFPPAPGPNDLTGQQLWRHFCPDSRPGSRGGKIGDALREFASHHACDLFLLDYHLVTSYGCDLKAALGDAPRMFFATSLLRWDEINLNRLDRPTIVFCPACFEVPKFRNRGPMVRYVEPSIFRQRGEPALPDAKYDARPLVLATWGTQSIRYAHLTKAQDLLRAVAQRHPELRFHMASARPREELFGCEPLPSNMLLEATLPQVSLLKSAALLVTHGGLNSLKEAIIEQVPALVLPFLMDQPYNALRVTRNGVGAALFPEEQTIESVEAAVLKAVSGSYRTALAKMREIFLAEEVAKPSHESIDSFLH